MYDCINLKGMLAKAWKVKVRQSRSHPIDRLGLWKEAAQGVCINFLGFCLHVDKNNVHTFVADHLLDTA